MDFVHFTLKFQMMSQGQRKEDVFVKTMPLTTQSEKSYFKCKGQSQGH